MAQGWIVNSTTDQITFNDAPAAAAAIVVKQFAISAINATDLWALGSWSDAYGYPREIEFFADRLWFASTRAQPQTMWPSETGNYSNFGVSTPIVDSDPINATLNSRQLNQIQDIIPLQNMVVLTSGMEYKASGGEGGQITPVTLAFRPQTYYGSSKLPALIVGGSALFAQRLGFAVYELQYDFAQDGYNGGDLLAFSAHLMDGYTLVDWAWQAVPYSCVWAMRSDGVALTMTYKREHQVVGWCRQVTLGSYERVTTIPGSAANDVYTIVKRTIDGVVKRYIERQFVRTSTTNVIDYVGLDCALTFDGRNTTATTITITGGTLWNHTEELTLTASTAIFAATDVGDQIVYGLGLTVPIRLTVTAYTSTTVIKARPAGGVVPAAYRSATTAWAFARDTLSGLAHLNGVTVGILADGAEQAQQVVPASGIINIAPPGAVVHVGIPYDCDIETLDVTVIGSETVAARRKIIKKVDLLVKSTRDILVGPDFDHLRLVPARFNEAMGAVPVLRTGLVECDVSGMWSTNGRVCIRHSAPLPFTLIAATPEVTFGT